MTKRRNVGIFIFDDVEVLDFAGPFEVFNVTGEVIQPAPFHTYTIALTNESIKARGKLSINPHYSIENCPQPDILLIPGGDGRKVLMNNPMMLTWVKEQYPKVEYMLSVCTGAFILAHAGLLDDLSATTHHGAFNEFKATLPQIKLIEDQRFVENGNIITSGGISAGIDMALYVVEKLLGQEKLQLTLDEMEYQWHQS